jgi:hypothetical protein
LLGLKPRTLFGQKELNSERGYESPFASVDSSFEYNSYSKMGTPVQMEKNYPLGYQNNDGSKCPQVNAYIATFIKEGDEGEKQFVKYQYQNNLFSPFNLVEQINREPLCTIQPFSLQK